MLLTVDAALFEFKDERWNTRALAGALRLNQTADGQTRLVMRAKGSGKLLLNANLWPEMTVSLMEGRGVTFAVVNHAGAPAAPAAAEQQGGADQGGEGGEADDSRELSTYAVRLREQGKADLLFRLIEENKKGPERANEEPTVVKSAEEEGAAEGVDKGADKKVDEAADIEAGK